MIIEADFLTHWKTKALVNAIGECAYRSLLALFAHCQTRKAWEFQMTPLMLAGICGYTEGPAERLFDSMKQLCWIEPGDELGWRAFSSRTVCRSALFVRASGPTLRSK
jgi:hypothetical protein